MATRRVGDRSDKIPGLRLAARRTQGTIYGDINAGARPSIGYEHIQEKLGVSGHRKCVALGQLAIDPGLAESRKC